MQYKCARCHHELTVEGEGVELPVCPHCGAEAGLEPVGGIPMAMKLFGVVVVGVIMATVGGGVISRVVGG